MTANRVAPHLAAFLTIAMAIGLVFVPTLDAVAVTRILGFESLPDGDPIADGTTVHDEFEESHDIRFPDGVVVQVCGSGRTCPSAYEGSRVATGKLATEFSNRPIDMSFTIAKSAVGFRVSAFNTAEAEVHAAAYDASGDVVATTTRSSVGRTSWAKMSLIDPKGADITRVVISGGTPGTSDNLIAIDELISDGPEGTPTGSDDVTPPVVQILDPSDGATISRSSFGAFVDIRDEEGGSGLARIDLEVVHTDSGTTTISPSGGNVCGATTTCPERIYHDFVTVSLDSNRPGNYRYTFIACDRDGNCGSAAHRIVYEPAEEDAPVRVMALEVNQGVQTRIFRDVTGPGTFQTYHSTVPLVPNRNTVVRVYLGADEEVAGKSVALNVTVLHEDGSTRRHTLRPNADPPTVDVPVESGDPERQLLEMRADLSRTMNFVIRASDLATADSFQMHVSDGALPITGTVTVPLGQFNELSFNLIRVVSETTGVPVRRSQVEAELLPYIRAALPVSRSLIISDRTFLWGGKYAIFNECRSLLFDVWWAYGGYDAPVRPRRDHPVWVPTAAIVDRIDGCNGVAFLGDPQDDDDRIGETLVSLRFGDTLAHEVGHTLSFLHAGNSHDEDAGWIADLTGSNYESWPYPHGTIGPDGLTTVFGIHSALRSDRSYDLELVDTCPTTDVNQRLPSCGVDDGERPHEVMSYGGPWGRTVGDLVMGRYRWPSDRTYGRVYDAIVRRLEATSTSTSRFSASTTDGEVPGLLVQGEVDGSGAVRLTPLMRKPVHASALAEGDEGGDLVIELRDSAGQVLASRAAQPSSHDAHPTMAFRAILPDVEEATAVVVRHGTRELGGLVASDNPPTVELTGPPGDELGTGPVEVTWQADDADGDATHALVQVSFDGGTTWTGVATARAGDTSTQIDLTGFQGAGTVELRVTVTDGFHTSTAQREYAFDPGALSARSTDSACPPPVPEAGFTDVAPGSVHAAPIDCMAWWDVTAGLGAGRYGPTVEVSRGQMASFVARLLEQAGTRLPDQPEDRFSDDDGTTHEAAINALAELGVVRGTGDGRFLPGQKVTRAQMVTYLMQALVVRTGLPLPADDPDLFSDDDGSVHELRINQAASLGVASGTASRRYDPSAFVRRDQMSSFLARLLDLLVVEGHAHPPAS